MAGLKTAIAALAIMGSVAGMTYPAAARDLIAGDWSGTYTCLQEMTRLGLVIMPDGDQWSGRFMFGPHESNPGVPFGSYEITVTETAGTYTIAPGAWIDRPDGYAAIGGSGKISADLRTFSGMLDYDVCDEFKVIRQTTTPVVSGKTK